MRVYYHSDPDGEGAAWCVKQKYPDEKIEFIKSNYDHVFDFSKIEKDEPVFAVDFSFKPDDFRRLLVWTKNVTWIDHHKTVLEGAYSEFSALAGIRSTEWAACKLAWLYLFPGVPVPRGIELIGDYDAWHHKYPESRHFHAACKVYGGGLNSQFWRDINVKKHFISDMCMAGKIIQHCESVNAEMYLGACGYSVVYDGLKILVCNIKPCGSDFFKSDDQDHDIYCAWVYRKGRKFVSVYVAEGKDVDVSEFAKKFDGGGHKGAAGFVCDKLPWEK